MERARISLPKIYPITHADQRTGQRTDEQAIRLIEAGARIVQIRDKHAASAELYETVCRVRAAARRSGALTVVNDRVDVALAAGAPAVHLGQTDLPPRAARELLGMETIIGLSTHSVEQAVAALNEPIDYIAIGPIFPTRTKTDPDPVVGLERISKVRSAIGDVPLVAIGGINGDNINSVLAAGADSAAIVSALLADGNIEQNFEAINSRIYS